MPADAIENVSHASGFPLDNRDEVDQPKRGHIEVSVVGRLSADLVAEIKAAEFGIDHYNQEAGKLNES